MRGSKEQESIYYAVNPKGGNTNGEKLDEHVRPKIFLTHTYEEYYAGDYQEDTDNSEDDTGQKLCWVSVGEQQRKSSDSAGNTDQDREEGAYYQQMRAFHNDLVFIFGTEMRLRNIEARANYAQYKDKAYRFQLFKKSSESA